MVYCTVVDLRIVRRHYSDYVSGVHYICRPSSDQEL